MFNKRVIPNIFIKTPQIHADNVLPRVQDCTGNPGQIRPDAVRPCLDAEQQDWYAQPD